jgi:hypothetical protein
MCEDGRGFIRGAELCGGFQTVIVMMVSKAKTNWQTVY